jgi:hypothetical protein
MKISTIGLAAGLIAIGSVALAQGGAPSGQGSTTGDPAASSQKPTPTPAACAQARAEAELPLPAVLTPTATRAETRCRTAA